MKVCIRCNPVSQLLTDENGELYCYLHGKAYILEEQPDPLMPEEAATETKTYVDGTEVTGPAPLPEQSPAEQEPQQ